MNAVLDVAVVGAGPAGANCAAWLARAGRAVALIEKARLPRYKTCGGGVVARALMHLPPGLELPFERRFNDVEMRLGGRTFRTERPQALVSLGMRAELDAELVRAATAAGAALHSPSRVVGIHARTDDVELTLESGALRARFVVIADGATGPSARLAGWTEPLVAIGALEAEVTLAPADFEPLAQALVFDFDAVAAGYGWIFPKRAHLSIGILSMQRGAPGLHALLKRYIGVLGARPLHVERHGYVIPIRPRRTFARGRVLLAGDAAGLADPVTAEGISLALFSGRLAARALLEESAPLAVGANYERLLAREILSDLRVARTLGRLLYFRPRLAERLFARSGQRLCEAMSDVIAGDATYRSLVARPRNWLRLATSLVHRRVSAQPALLPRRHP
jgi:geranylgeranyl reductase family protein